MKFILFVAALACYNLKCVLGFWSLSNYREAQQSYHEITTNCQREGGRCIYLGFGTTPIFPPTLPLPTPPPVFVPHSPRILTRAPTTTTKAPPTTIRPSPATNRTKPKSTKARKPKARKRKPTTEEPELIITTQKPKLRKKVQQKPRKGKKQGNGRKGKKQGNGRKGKKQGNGRKGKNKKQRVVGEREFEREVRKRRQVADPLYYLYDICTGGWEFDVGCGPRSFICCYTHARFSAN